MYYVQSTANVDAFYIIDSNISICTCPKGNAGGPCKHQAAVAIKFHQSSINYIPSLSLNDRMCYTYIAQGICVMDKSFYVKFHAEVKTKNSLENSNTNPSENAANLIEKNCIGSWENSNTNPSENAASSLEKNGTGSWKNSSIYPLENSNTNPSENAASPLENNGTGSLENNGIGSLENNENNALRSLNMNSLETIARYIIIKALIFK